MLGKRRKIQAVRRTYRTGCFLFHGGSVLRLHDLDAQTYVVQAKKPELKQQVPSLVSIGRYRRGGRCAAYVGQWRVLLVAETHLQDRRQFLGAII